MASAIAANQFYPVTYFATADPRLLEAAKNYFKTFNPVESSKLDNLENQFTKSAKKFWESIPEDIKEKLIHNVWCSNCSEVTTIVHFKGTIESGELILRGDCKRCGHKVARVIEKE